MKFKQKHSTIPYFQIVLKTRKFSTFFTVSHRQDEDLEGWKKGNGNAKFQPNQPTSHQVEIVDHMVQKLLHEGLRYAAGQGISDQGYLRYYRAITKGTLGSCMRG